MLMPILYQEQKKSQTTKNQQYTNKQKEKMSVYEQYLYGTERRIAFGVRR
jgi:phage major head subunit gpT-like protein